MMSAVSWLCLEQYAAGALEPERRREVEAALAADPALQKRFDAIQADHRPLPLLDLSALPADSGLALPPVSPVPDNVVALSTWRRRRVVLGGLALAAAATLVVVTPTSPPTVERPPAAIAYKGGNLAVAVDRQRGETTLADPESYLDGDRIRVRLTCPPGDRHWSLAVYQGADRVHPLSEDAPLSCANNVVLPGAFTVSGPGEVTICAGVDEAAAALRAGSWEPGVVCLSLADGS